MTKAEILYQRLPSNSAALEYDSFDVSLRQDTFPPGKSRPLPLHPWLIPREFTYRQ